MSSWGDNEKKLWNTSETLREFEKQTAERAVKLAEALQKSAVSPALQDLKGIADAATKAQTAIQNVKKELKSYSDDGEVSENDPSDESIELPEKEKQEELVKELQSMAQEAIDLGNVKLAYKIERTIDEILGR